MKKTAIALVVLGCCALTGCGENSSSASVETTTFTGPMLTKKQLIKQGDAICAASYRRIEKAGKKLGKGDATEADLMAYVTDVVLPELQGQLKDLRALTPPAKDAVTIDKMLDNLEAGLKNQAKSATEDDPLIVKATRTARRYGFKVCSKE